MNGQKVAEAPTENILASRRACDDCRSRKIKCILNSEVCESCQKRQIPCTFEKKAPKKNRKKDSFMNIPAPDNSFKIEKLPLPKKSRTSEDRTSAWVERTSAEMGLQPEPVLQAAEISFAVKTDAYGSLTVVVSPDGSKVAHFSISASEDAHPVRYTHVSSTKLLNHPFEDLTTESCQTHEVLGLLTSQQIYLTIVFFAQAYPKNPSLDLANFKQQLMYPISTSLLFLLNCICAVACPYGSNSKVRFDKTMFYFKALEIHYFKEDTSAHPNWTYGHSLLKELNPKLAS